MVGLQPWKFQGALKMETRRRSLVEWHERLRGWGLGLGLGLGEAEYKSSRTNE